MLLAAGLGTRLRPLTDSKPKALVEVGGVPILEHVARGLIAAGADRLIINLHHLGEQIREFVVERDGFGVEVIFSPEPGAPLETGGGLLHARPLLRSDRPFFLHNADILSDLPLRPLYEAHGESGALATLAVMDRETSRHLLFDERGLLGWLNTRGEGHADIRVEARTPVGEVTPLAFSGVHVISPPFLDLLSETGVFSIIQPYLRLSAAGHGIHPFRVDGCGWFDIGSLDQLAAANRWLERRLL